jgi:hypothetical protein
MNCIYCNTPITGRKKGDHIIPQGLGKFLPDLTINHTCRNCDSNNGSNFEKIAIRTGFIGFFRALKGIKSRNNRNLPHKSPSLDKFNAIESQQFSITDSINPDKLFYINRNGQVRFPNRILVRKYGNIIHTINIPNTHDIRDICNFIEEKTPVKIDGLESELRICDELFNDVIYELKRRGKRFSQPTKSDNTEEYKILRIQSIMTENHFRFVTSTVLKAMLYLNYNIKLLEPMIDYVKTGNTINLLNHYIDEKESMIDAKDNPPLHFFSYLFEWGINEKAILISTSILAHKNVNGIRMKLAIKTGVDKSIIIPFGKVIARYGETPLDNKLELYHGNCRIC